MVANRITPNALDSFGTRSPSKSNPYFAMKAAKALFPLEKIPLSEWSGKRANPDLFVVVRTDTNTVIGQVGKKYECFPNEDFFGPVAEALVNSGAEISRFQMIDGGTRCFMRLAWGDDYNLRIGSAKVGDIVGRRAILSTSHDGKFAGKFVFQMLRLACSNGMTVPVGAYDISLTHTVGGRQQLVELTEMVPTIETYVHRYQLAADLLAATKVRAGGKTAMSIIRQVADPREIARTMDSGESNLAQKRVNRISELFGGDQPDSDNRAVKNTGWGLYNACVDFYTHGLDGNDSRSEKRFKSLLPGGNASTEIVKAWNVVTKGLKIDEVLQTELATVN